MKRLLPFIICVAFSSSNVYAAAQIKFETLVCNYGILQQNDDGNRTFKFYNVGSEPLIIVNVNSSCGCLVPTWPKNPIMPGESGIIKAHYSTDRIGAFEKTLTVFSNSENDKTIVLKIKGIVYEHLTTLQMDTYEIDAGTIRFGDEKKYSVKYSNTGGAFLSANLSSYENDIINVKRRDAGLMDSALFRKKKDSYYKFIADTGYLDIKIRNLVGNSGSFTHKLFFAGNFKDTVWITVKGVFKGQSNKDTILMKENVNYYGLPVEVEKLFVYKNKQLNSVTYIITNKNYNGELVKKKKNFEYKFGKETLVIGSYLDYNNELPREVIINGIRRNTLYK